MKCLFGRVVAEYAEFLFYAWDDDDPQVVDAGHHQRRLFELTGLRVQANQARALLSDLWRYKAKWEDGVGHAIPAA